MINHRIGEEAQPVINALRQHIGMTFEDAEKDIVDYLRRVIVPLARRNPHHLSHILQQDGIVTGLLSKGKTVAAEVTRLIKLLPKEEQAKIKAIPGTEALAKAEQSWLARVKNSIGFQRDIA